MAAAASPHAVDAAHEIVQAGGNAVDAAIAASMVLGVVEPGESGLGGGGFLLVHAPDMALPLVYDGREMAPAAARPDRFLLLGGLPMPRALAIASGRSVGIPGLLAMLADAHREHGRLPWSRLFEPAIRLAEAGVPTPPRLAKYLTGDPTLGLFTGTRALFSGIDTDGHWRNPVLAETLRRIAEQGTEAFYEGPIAADIVAAIGARLPWPGDATMSDFADYEAVRRDALCRPYRRWTVCGAPPPSFGGIGLLQMLGMLERFDMAALEPMSPKAVHLIAEASRLSFADLSLHGGDPTFVEVPTAALVDGDYLSARGSLISPRRAMAQAPAGRPPAIVARPSLPPLSAGGENTSHLSIVDREGMAVALTASIEAPFGSRIAVRGFLLNNQLTDFDFVPEQAGRPAANAVAPGKRPLSAMAPTLVFGPEGALRLVIGSRGGRRIVGYVAKTVIAVLDWGMPLDAAIALPNFAHVGDRLELEEGTALAALQPSLEAIGHEVLVRPLVSGLHGVEFVGGAPRGGADPRLDGVAR